MCCCAACSCLSSCLACGICGTCNKEHSSTSRLPYVLLFVLSIIFALLLSFYGSITLADVYDWEVKACYSESCTGNQAVFRITFILFLFFMFHAFFMMCGDDAAQLHGKYWGVKLLVYFVLIFVMFLIPNNDLFNVYAEIARIVSIIFLIIQLLVLILSVYTLSEAWVAKIDEGSTVYTVLFLGSSFSIYILCIILWAFYFIWFAPNGVDGCGYPEKDRNSALIAVTIVMTIIHTVISASKWCEHGSLLCSAGVTLYTTFLCYSSLYSDPSACNTLGYKRTSAEKWIGLVWASISISYSAYTLATFKKAYRKEEDLNADVELEEKKKKADEGEVEDDEWTPEEKVEIRKVNRNFHLLMACGAMYGAMLLSNWGTDVDTENTEVDVGVTNLWVKTSASWLCILLYLWTLIADKALPLCGREL